ncbi:MAG: phage shock protein PspC [Parcubacteria group bacterium]|nr:phage shock protein PspC [Parcubacteria group bacterium]
MNKVTSINLGGNAYSLEESAHDSLKSYLDQALLALEGNPDKEEIQKDLERSIGEKCNRFLNAHKSVISKEDIEVILKEMGPVEGDTSSHEDQKKNEDLPKRLYNIREGAKIGGVANGLAAYFNVDVTLVRLAFIILTLLTHGGFILLYVLMMIFIPYAHTSEQKARAYGVPFTAQELIDNAKRGFEDLKRQKNYWKEEGKKWKTKMEEQHKEYEVKEWHPRQNWLVEVIWSIFGFVIASITVTFGLWLAYHHVPEVHQFFDSVGTHAVMWTERFDR